MAGASRWRRQPGRRGPERWFDLPPGFGAGEDGLDLRPGRLLIAVEQFAGDIWVVDFAPQGSF